MTSEVEHGWVSVGDGIELPYIVRTPGQKFIPVKLVDRLILRHYPNSYPKELTDKPPLICQFLNNREASALSALCESRYGMPKLVGTLDPIVNFNEFHVFYDIVRRAYPEVNIATEKCAPLVYGWLLFRDAMVPYVERNEAFLLPLNVVQGAAQLLIGIDIKTIPATKPEIDCLNNMCRKEGMTFTFQKNTGLVDLTSVALLSPGCPIRQLPPDDPLSGLVNGSDVNGAPPELAALQNYPPPPPLVPINLIGGQPPTPLAGHQQLLPLVPHDKPQAVSRTQPNPANPQIVANQPQVLTIQRNADVASHAPQTDSTSATLTAQHMAKPMVDNQWMSIREEREPVKIKSVDCFGKTISCITRGKLKTKYALVEALCRVFFPHVNLLDFVHYLENDLSVKLYSLKKPEEAAFIDFFCIPTEQLRCNLLIKLKEFMERMTWLREKFGTMEPNVVPVPTKKEEIPTNEKYNQTENMPKEHVDQATPKQLGIPEDKSNVNPIAHSQFIPITNRELQGHIGSQHKIQQAPRINIKPLQAQEHATIAPERIPQSQVQDHVQPTQCVLPMVRPQVRASPAQDKDSSTQGQPEQACNSEQNIDSPKSPLTERRASNPEDITTAKEQLDIPSTSPKGTKRDSSSSESTPKHLKPSQDKTQVSELPLDLTSPKSPS